MIIIPLFCCHGNRTGRCGGDDGGDDVDDDDDHDDGDGDGDSVRLKKVVAIIPFT